MCSEAPGVAISRSEPRHRSVSSTAHFPKLDAVFENSTSRLSLIGCDPQQAGYELASEKGDWLERDGGHGRLEDAAKRFDEEIVNAHNLPAIPAWFADDFVDHVEIPGMPSGVAGVIARHEMLFTAMRTSTSRSTR